MPGNIPYRASKQQFGQKVTAKLRGAFSLGDQPSGIQNGYLGYFHQQDPTTYSPNRENVLTYPSINCFIPFRDKIIPRLGTTLLGAPYTGQFGSTGHMKKYGTMSGLEIELRVNATYPAPTLDIIYALVPEFIGGIAQSTLQWLPITLTANPLPVGKHEYYFDQWFDTNLDPSQALNLSRAVWVNGTEEIYSWSGGIAPIVSIVPGVSISTNAGVTWRSLGFIDPAFDNSLNGTITVNGVAYTVTGGWETDTLLVTSTVGIFVNNVAFSQIQQISTPVNITGTITHGAVTGGTFNTGDQIIGSVSGAMAFVTSDGAGPGPLLLYGVQAGPTTGLFFQPGETITDIVTKAFTTVTTYTMTNLNRLAFDVCRNNNGYMYYGSWNSMKLYQSNQFAKPADTEITNVQAVQNDLVIGTTPYIGTGQNVYRVTIDGVNPAPTIFTGSGSNALTFDISGYTASGIVNVYKVVVSKFQQTVKNSIQYGNVAGGPFVVGETITAAPSGATAIVQYDNQIDRLLLDPASVVGVFQPNDTITGGTSGATAKVSSFDIDPNSFRQFGYFVFKNNINVANFPLQSLGIPLAGPFTVADSIKFSIPTNVIGFNSPALGAIPNALFYNGSLQNGDTWEITVSNPTSDTFQWQINGAAPIQQHVAITGGVQNLNNGVSISFVNTTGHTLGDYWDITATQAVGGNNPTLQNLQAFANFYYTLPQRIPGEGFIYQLSANFWAMAPQESQMYVCNNYGAWAYVTTSTTANTVTGTNETISLTPLKQVSSSKPIFPYMIGYLDNDLIYVTTDKKLDLIGRQQLIQLPRIDTLSHPVDLDFQAVSYLNGSIEYWDKKMFITSPHENIMFCYDNHPENLYWQPPQMIPENGILSIINQNGEDVLISHSTFRNQSWKLFTGIDGDNGAEYLVQARTPYSNKGDRWGIKNSNKSFCEGHITAAPQMRLTVYQDVNGCSGIDAHAIVPDICVANTIAPFGKGNFGSHENGSDLFADLNYFAEVYPFQNTLEYYFIAVQMSCLATNHSYEWLTFGVNTISAGRGNINRVNQQVILTD